jgi:transposase
MSLPPALPQTLPEAHELIQQLRWHVAQLQKQLYGPSAEAGPAPEPLSKEQILLSLFPAPAEPAATAEVAVPEPPSATETEPTPRRRRHPAARVLETLTQRLEPQEKICPHCQKPKCEIDCLVTERFEYVPAKIVRHEIHRPKLACPCGQGTVAIAPLPPTVVEKGYPGPGLVAQVILSKYADHLPLYRQQQQLERLGVNFTRQMLCHWVEKGAFLLQSLVVEMKAQLLQGDYLQVDETPVRVMDPEVKGKCATGYLWLAGRPQGDVIFEFHPGRGKEYAQQLLGDFKGYLQRDGYGVYGALAKERPQILSCGCWAHARRKFVEAWQMGDPQAEWPVLQIRRLYYMEKRARDEALSAPQRWALRQELAPPILEELKAWMEQLRPSLLPQSPLGKAISYALAEWEPLRGYLQDGRIEIDNNLTENAIRPTCVGKKNYLFIGHPDAGWRSATIYSLIVSCRRHGVDPWAYIKDMMEKLPAAKSHEVAQMVPARWKPASA